MLPRTTSLEEWKRVGSQSSLPKKKKGEIYPDMLRARCQSGSKKISLVKLWNEKRYDRVAS